MENEYFKVKAGLRNSAVVSFYDRVPDVAMTWVKYERGKYSSDSLWAFCDVLTQKASNDREGAL